MQERLPQSLVIVTFAQVAVVAVADVVVEDDAAVAALAEDIAAGIVWAAAVAGHTAAAETAVGDMFEGFADVVESRSLHSGVVEPRSCSSHSFGMYLNRKARSH